MAKVTTPELRKMALVVAENLGNQAAAHYRTLWVKHNPPEEYDKAYHWNMPKYVALVYHQGVFVAGTARRFTTNTTRLNYDLSATVFFNEAGDKEYVYAMSGADHAVVERFIQKRGTVRRYYMKRDETSLDIKYDVMP